VGLTNGREGEATNALAGTSAIRRSEVETSFTILVT